MSTKNKRERNIKRKGTQKERERWEKERGKKLFINWTIDQN